MTGLIEELLAQRFGPPSIAEYEGLSARTWNAADERRRCQLLVGLEWDVRLHAGHEHLSFLYGDSFGGFILRDSLRIASLARREVWGLYRISDLQGRPEVRRALSLEPSVDYFMDAANVWYYGHRGGQLYCYDAENDCVENLGDTIPAMDALISEWLETTRRT